MALFLARKKPPVDLGGVVELARLIDFAQGHATYDAVGRWGGDWVGGELVRLVCFAQGGAMFVAVGCWGVAAAPCVLCAGAHAV